MITVTDFAKYYPSQKILSCKDLTIGWERYVYLFETTEGKYVVKKAKKDEVGIRNEVFAKRLIADLDLPVPHILHTDKNLIIEPYIEGTLLTEDKPLSLYKELGECVRKIHSIKTIGFGEMKELGVGKYENEIDSIHECGDLNCPEVKAHHYLKTINIPHILENNTKLLNSKDSVLIHGDLDFENLLAKEDKLVGIVDFGDSAVSTPERDLGLLYISFGKEEIWKSFLEGYKNEFDMRKAMLYGFLVGTYYVAIGAIKEDSNIYTKYINIVHTLS